MIQIPEGLRVLDIRGNLLVGRVRGAMDVEQVHVHRIERGG